MARHMIQPHERGSAGVMFTAAFLSGLVLLFIGERLVESNVTRIALGVFSSLLFLFAVGGRLRRISKLGDAAKSVEKRLLWLTLLGIAALGVYLAQADFVMESLRASFSEPRGADRYEGTLAVIWVVLLLISTMPMIFVEVAYGPMATGSTVDLGRVKRSLASGLVLAMSIAIVFTLNFMAAQYNKKVDLSYFKTTRPSESSLKMVKNLSEPLQVRLFYATGNEVLAPLRAYFNELEGQSKKLQVKVVDQYLERKLAKKYSVTKNGTVLFTRKGQHHQLSVGTKLRRARNKLKKLDSEFQNAFMKLSRAQKVAYLTVGHEERGRDKRDEVKGSSIRDLRTVLKKLNYRIKDLGVGQGLANEIPKDASVVIIAGPRKPFMDAEVNALKAYVRRGGRVMALIDPDTEDSLTGLLGPFGLKYNKEQLANDRFYARVTHTEADRYAVFSNRYGTHTSVKTLSRFSRRVTTVLFGAGHLEEIPPTEGGMARVVFTIHSMPFTYNDLNGNRAFDKGSEKRKLFELAAAVSMDRLGKNSDKKSKKSAPDDGRLFVVADSDVFADRLFRHTGNLQLFVDAIKWLGGDEKYIGAPSSEEDVRIVHTRKEDQVWFYLTIFAIPALVLGAGLTYNRRRRKRS